MELHLGKMTNKELAEWFGIKVQSLKNKKKEKLKELEKYADFEEIYGGVNILKIKIKDEYSKERSLGYQIVRDTFDEEWAESGLDTCSNVSNKIYTKYKDNLPIAANTTYNYTIQVRNEKYGVPFIGDCFYIWCKKSVAANGTLIYTEFSEEEKKIKDRLMRKYFSTDVEKEVLVAEMVEGGEISKEQAYDMLCEIKNLNGAGFAAFKSELELEIGCPIVKGTMINRKQELLGESLDFSK